MTSVFETQPPSFSKKTIDQILSKNFKINGNISFLESDRDQNTLIETYDGEKYILKISNPAEDLRVLDMQNQVALHIKLKDPELLVPMQIGDLETVKCNEQTYFVRLMKYINGGLLKDHNMDFDAFENLGCFIGRLNCALEGFYHSAADREFHWDVRSIHLIRKRENFLNDLSDKRIINQFLDQFESSVLSTQHKLRKIIIHNDCNDQNVLVNSTGETIGIIDFGDMVYSYQVVEPAVCMAYVGIESSNPFRSMGKVLKGYHSVIPLNSFELNSIIYLIVMRLCISVTMAAWRKEIFPKNKYLSVSEKRAWEFLRKLAKEDLNLISEKIIKYVV